MKLSIYVKHSKALTETIFIFALNNRQPLFWNMFKGRAMISFIFMKEKLCFSLHLLIYEKPCFSKKMNHNSKIRNDNWKNDDELKWLKS